MSSHAPAAPDAGSASWLAHLREGGSTPWLDWTATGAPALTGSEHAGAFQLDLLRRVNAHGALPHRVDDILTRPAPGRGAADPPLPDPPPRGSTHEALAGSPDPRLRALARAYPDVAPRGEILRLGAGVVADLTAELDTDLWQWRAQRVPAPRRPGGPTYLLTGAAGPVADLRARLAAAGRPEGGRRHVTGRTDPPDLVLLVAGPLGPALADFWSWRTKMGATRSWRAVVARAARRDELPAPLAYHQVAAAHVDAQVDAQPAPVHVLTVDGLDDQVEAVLGVRPAGDAPAVRRPQDPLPLLPAYVDVVRRVNAVLPFQAEEPRLSDLRRALVAVLAEGPGVAGPQRLEVPREHRAWLVRKGREVADALVTAGHPVHGDLAGVYEWSASGSPRLHGTEALDALVDTVHRLDRAARGGGDRR